MLKDVVLVGAGHAHLMVLRDLRRKPPENTRLTLVTPEPGKVYSGMVPGLIAGHYRFDQAQIDIERLARRMGAGFEATAVIGLDIEGRRVLCRGQAPIPYDLLSIDIGSMPSGTDLPGVAELAILSKPLDRLVGRIEALSQDVCQAGGRARIGIVGGGAAGVELTLALDDRLRRDLRAAGCATADLAFILLTASPCLLSDHAPSAQRLLQRILERRGIAVRTAARVVAIETDGTTRLVTADGRAIDVDHVLWATEATAPPWLRDTTLALDERGFIAVEPTLRCVAQDKVFAAGDVASVRGEGGLAKSGVRAVRQGRILAHNLRRALANRPLATYQPQPHALALISTGDRRAVGTRNGFAVEGGWVWHWKDYLDRGFVYKFRKLT